MPITSHILNTIPTALFDLEHKTTCYHFIIGFIYQTKLQETTNELLLRDSSLHVDHDPQDSQGPPPERPRRRHDPGEPGGLQDEPGGQREGTRGDMQAPGPRGGAQKGPGRPPMGQGEGGGAEARREAPGKTTKQPLAGRHAAGRAEEHRA